MESSFSPLQEVHMLAKLADLKDEQYHTLLNVCAMVELLVDKGVLTREEIRNKTAELDAFMAHPPYPTA